MHANGANSGEAGSVLDIPVTARNQDMDNVLGLMATVGYDLTTL